MVPICSACVGQVELIAKGSFGGNSAICHPEGTVHTVRPILVLTMPVQRRRVRERVVDINNKDVVLVRSDERARELRVDGEETSSDTCPGLAAAKTRDNRTIIPSGFPEISEMVQSK